MSKKLVEIFQDFESDLARHELFLKIESRIKNPASSKSRPRSETLLSAYVSLSCGRFEHFLQQSFYFAADDLRNRIGFSNDRRITKFEKFHWQNMHGFLKWAANAKGIDRPDMITKIELFSNAISAGKIFPESFKYTNANPNSETVRAMFARFGIDRSFDKVASHYIDSRGRKLNASLIEISLDSFVKRRHEAAHHGRIQGMTRVDAQNDHVFISGLAGSIRNVLIDHIGAIV